MTSMRFTNPGSPLLGLPTPGQREIRRRPARDLSLHRPHQSTVDQEVQPHV